MATQTFYIGLNKAYHPGHEVRYNGVRGRFWTEFNYENGCWIKAWTRFRPLRATRKQIADFD